MANKWVYMFSEGDMTMRNLLGGKGANLAEMTSIGLPVPQGFTITTEACTQYYEDGRKINDEIMAQAMEGVKKMEEINGKKFGDLKNPLLVSVRSGARASMPAKILIKYISCLINLTAISQLQLHILTLHITVNHHILTFPITAAITITAAIRSTDTTLPRTSEKRLHSTYVTANVMSIAISLTISLITINVSTVI